MQRVRRVPMYLGVVSGAFISHGATRGGRRKSRKAHTGSKISPNNITASGERERERGIPPNTLIGVARTAANKSSRPAQLRRGRNLYRDRRRPRRNIEKETGRGVSDVGGVLLSRRTQYLAATCAFASRGKTLLELSRRKRR